MQPRFTAADMAMVCHEMRCGLRLAMGSPFSTGMYCWPAISTAAKAAEIEQVERYLRQQHTPAEGLSPDARVEEDLFTLIVGRMAAELR